VRHIASITQQRLVDLSELENPRLKGLLDPDPPLGTLLLGHIKLAIIISNRHSKSGQGVDEMVVKGQEHSLRASIDEVLLQLRQ
jgi:hypothetical protein